MMVFVLQKKLMIFTFSEVFSEKHHKLVGKIEDLLAGKPLGKSFGKLLFTAQPEKMNKGAPVELLREAKADLLWVGIHRGLLSRMSFFKRILRVTCCR